MFALILLVAGYTSGVKLPDNTVRVITTGNPNPTIEQNITAPYMIATDETGQGFLVETDRGTVRGYRSDNSILHYFDIPYGSFTAERPFQAPSEAEPWESIHDTPEHRSFCPQINSEDAYVGNEQCLTLSVFKQENAENADVLFHIHDSSFNVGSGNPVKYGPKYLVPHGIVLVLPNYRLGPLGFLCMQNQTAPGNAGLKDLTLALNWTIGNIEAFGGNSSNIVISGSGAAGALVEYLLLSNNSRPLISRAIIESGFVLSPWAFDRYPMNTVNSLIKNINNAAIATDNLYHVLEEISLETLVRAGKDINFRPCVTNETGFLTESPWHVLNNEKLKVTVMTGSANQAAMDKALQHTDESLAQINQDCFLLLPEDLKFSNNEDRRRIGEEVKQHYFGENNITMNDMEKLSQCYTDSKYLFPGIRGARLLAKGGSNVYVYEFSYGKDHPVDGSARGDILNFVFSKEEVASEPEAESQIKDTVLNLWVSFIKNGKPSVENIEWDKLNGTEGSEEPWLSIGDEVRMQKGFHQSRLKLWDEIYENHFIEHNLATKLNYSIYIILFSILFSLKVF